MKKTIIVFGLISGALVSIMMICSLPLITDHSGNTGYSMLVGYATMLLAFCLIFIGVKNYRDKQQGGTISFKSAFLIGLGIAAIASVCYTATWIVIYKNFYPGFMEEMISSELAAMARKGKSAAEIAKASRKMEGMRAAYATWPGLISMTMVEILPLGIVVSLITALVMRKRPRGGTVAVLND